MEMISETRRKQIKFLDVQDKDTGGLAEDYIVPPFSVLDTRQKKWQSRRRYWLALGLRSEVGRNAECFNIAGWMKEKRKSSPDTNQSVFDPVLTEICYKWFCPDKGGILDPFAGGSVRGIVAHNLGYKYVGIDLSEKQIIENREQAIEILDEDNQPRWIVGDSAKVLDTIKNQRPKADLIFSCPPYFDLEKYGEKEGELSNMDDKDFVDAYQDIIKKCIYLLKDNSFACFVVGNIRNKDGFYRDLAGITVKAFQDSGAAFYNDIVLINTAGSLPVRVRGQFEPYRKVGKMHQNVLVFYKGDPKKIKDKFSSRNDGS